MRRKPLPQIVSLSILLSLLACQKADPSSQISAEESAKRLKSVQAFARTLLEEQVASIKSLKLSDEQESYVGGSEAKELAVLQGLVRNLGGLMTATYLAEGSDGLDGMSFPDSKRRVLRDAHPKGLLCLNASFEVQPNTLFSSGFLSQAASYPAVVRFSSSAPSVQTDKVSDIRGFAVKVRTENGSGRGHDFVNLSTPSFPTDTSGEFLDLVKVVRISKCGQDPRGFAACAADTGVPNPINLAVAASRLLKGGSGDPQNSLFQKTFFGVTSYRYAAEGEKLYFKFRFDPEACPASPADSDLSLKSQDGKNFLAENVREVLSRQAACYGLKIVPLAEGSSARVLEQHTKTWEEQGIAEQAVKVGTLRFEKNAKELDMTSCDEQTFSPDNASPGFQALGSLNRARGLVYEKLAAFRKRLNQEIQKAGL